jgi:CRP-like cAMP-binding protein
MQRPNNSATGSVMTNLPDPRENALLASLFRSGWQRWESQLEPFELTPGQVLFESGCQSEYLYFPITALVSLLHPAANGSAAEIAAVDNQGVVGIGLLLGGIVTPGPAVVRVAGIGFRMKAQLIRDEFNQSNPLMELMLRYTQALIAQMAHNIGRLAAI